MDDISIDRDDFLSELRAIADEQKKLYSDYITLIEISEITGIEPQCIKKRADKMGMQVIRINSPIAGNKPVNCVSREDAKRLVKGE
jgi:hypothetical protein